MAGKAYTVDELRSPVRPTVLQWPEFQAMFLSSHKQGEHVAIVGPTGGGKTVVGTEICKLIGSRMAKDRRPSRVTILVLKPKDDTVSSMNWPVLKRWPPGYGQEHCVVWPRGGAPSEAAARQRAVFKPLLDQMYVEGGQAVYIPEAADFEAPVPHGGLGLKGTMRKFWADARSNSLTVIGDTQRPRFVTRSMWTEPSWLIILEPEDEDDLKEVAKLSGQKIAVWNTVPQLGTHEFLCIRRQRGEGGKKELYVSKVDKSSAVTRYNRDNHNGRGQRP